MHLFILLLCSSFVAAKPAISPTRTSSITPGPKVGGIKAIVPTASGQIGINPVNLYLGNATEYVGLIDSTDVAYITVSDTLTKWIGVNTEYLQEISVNPTSTRTAHIMVTTGLVDGKAVKNILLSEPLSNVLQATTEVGLKVCKYVPKSKQKRSSEAVPREIADELLSCILDQAAKATAEGTELTKLAEAGEWAELGLQLADGARKLIVQTLALMTNVQRQRMLLACGFYVIAMGVGYTATGNWANTWGLGETKWNIGKISYPKEGFDKPEECKKCPANMEKAENSPLCIEDACQGINGRCTVCPNELCPCLEIVDYDPYMLNKSYVEMQQEMLIGFDSMGNSPSKQDYECDINAASQFPYNVFTGVYGKFCEVVDNNKKSALTWIVDSSGNKIPPRKESLQARSPPPNPASYQDFRVDLEWLPDSNLDSTCDKSCSDGFSWLANTQCGHTGGQQNLMTRNGTARVGCGTYSFKIEEPNAAPSTKVDKAVFVIWYLPIWKGPALYNFFDKDLDWKGDPTWGCGKPVNPDNRPTVSLADPKLKDFNKMESDDQRPDSGLERQAPGSLGPMKIMGKTGCTYQEDKINGIGRFSCENGDYQVVCRAPTPEVSARIAPNNGACGQYKNIVNPVIVCHYS